MRSIAVLLWTFPSIAMAFVVVPSSFSQQQRQQQRLFLPGTIRADSSQLFLDRSDEDIESSSSSSSSAAEDEIRSLDFISKQLSSCPPPPLLTSIGRERRQAEIVLLQSLERSDDAAASLWNLWYNERGPSVARAIHEIEALMEDPSKWPDAEQLLRGMIREHGAHFCEPLNRLATLCYLRGSFGASKQLCERVLEIKPWHMGALSGIVLVCANMNLLSEARHWAAKRLPPLPPAGTTNPRRSEWIQRAVADAELALRQEEERLQRAFAETSATTSDESNAPKKQSTTKTTSPPPPPLDYNSNVMEEDEEDAWQ